MTSNPSKTPPQTKIEFPTLVPEAAETSMEIQMTRTQITDPSATKEMLFLTVIGKIENYIHRKFGQLNQLNGRYYTQKKCKGQSDHTQGSGAADQIHCQ